ncbi:alpha amylase C-terminal domain-containing protein, partial [uncultured Muriicola sp.]|uniref:alpha amylase C-terminal domain-containing protein n=1 Tax=uncultured Muriicola sp. TaxID=1583102 RepID=UPI002618F443
GYMFAHPGANLLFMGAEFVQSSEWNFQQSLDWHLLQYDFHSGIQSLVKDLNTFYKKQPALFEKQFSGEGFQWIDYGDFENSVLTFIRKGNKTENDLVIACNFTPIPREKYRMGVPKSGQYKEVFNTDAKKYGGSGSKNTIRKTAKKPWHGHKQSIEITIPPLGMVVFQ